MREKSLFTIFKKTEFQNLSILHSKNRFLFRNLIYFIKNIHKNRL